MYRRVGDIEPVIESSARGPAAPSMPARRASVLALASQSRPPTPPYRCSKKPLHALFEESGQPSPISESSWAKLALTLPKSAVPTQYRVVLGQQDVATQPQDWGSPWLPAARHPAGSRNKRALDDRRPGRRDVNPPHIVGLWL